MSLSATLVRSPSLLQQHELETAVCRALCCDLAALENLDLGAEKSGSASEGYLSQCGSMTVKAVVKGRPHTLHLFVKRENTKEVVEGLEAFQREGLFYESVLPHLDKAWNNVKAAESDEHAASRVGAAAFLGTDSVVVMEDLTRRGYKAIPDWQWNDIPYQTVQQTLRALARLHASSLVAERVCGVDLAAEVPELMEENFLTRRPGIVGRRIFDVASDLVAQYILPRIFSRLKVPQTAFELRRLQDLTRDIWTEMDLPKLREREAVRAISNGDVWPNNVLVRHDSQGQVAHAIVVDFQMVHLGPPALDVAMFLRTSMRRAHRQRHEESLVREYHDDLVRFCQQRGLDLSKDFGWEDFKASLARVEPVARGIACAYNPMIRGNEAEMEETFKESAARSAMLLESAARADMILRWMESDEAYLELMIEIVEDVLGLPASASTKQ